MTAFVLGAVVFLVVLCGLLIGAAVAINRGRELLASALVGAAVAALVIAIAYLYLLGEVAR